MTETVVYRPRAFVHDERMGAVKSRPNRLMVLHTTEGGEGTDSAEQLAAFCGLPGDKTSSSGSKYGASYQYVLDTDSVIPLVPENVVSYSAPPTNNDGIHIVYPGKAGQTRLQWLDLISGRYIHQCALLMQDISRRTGIPLIHLTDAEIIAGRAGYCDHWAISRCYHQTDHTDVGASYAWDVLLHDLFDDDQPPPPPEDDMKISILTIRDSTPQATFIGLADEVGKFLEVRWINGNDPKQATLLDDHRRAKAPEFSFGSNVTRSLVLTSTEIPIGVHGDGSAGTAIDRPWSVDDWGLAPYLP